MTMSRVVVEGEVILGGWVMVAAAREVMDARTLGGTVRVVFRLETQGRLPRMDCP